MSELEALMAFEEMNHLLVPLGALNSPTELHGLLCGKLCGGQRLKADEWLTEALTFLDLETCPEAGVVDDLDGTAQAAVARLYPVALAQLEDSEYGFQLLLPADDADLDRRATGLGEWCHGFLSGFGSAGLAPSAEFSPEAADALRDLAAIVSIGDDADESDDEAEANFMEIVEYVRMATLTLFLDFGRRQESSDPKTVH